MHTRLLYPPDNKENGWQAKAPNATYFSQYGNAAGFVGQTPWSARVPLDPLFGRRIKRLPAQKAGQGAGCGRGASAPQSMQACGHGKSVRHWAKAPAPQHRKPLRTAVGQTLPSVNPRSQKLSRENASSGRSGIFSENCAMRSSAASNRSSLNSLGAGSGGRSAASTNRRAMAAIKQKKPRPRLRKRGWE